MPSVEFFTMVLQVNEGVVQVRLLLAKKRVECSIIGTGRAAWTTTEESRWSGRKLESGAPVRKRIVEFRFRGDLEETTERRCRSYGAQCDFWLVHREIRSASVRDAGAHPACHRLGPVGAAYRASMAVGGGGGVEHRGHAGGG